MQLKEKKKKKSVTDSWIKHVFKDIGSQIDTKCKSKLVIIQQAIFSINLG